MAHSSRKILGPQTKIRIGNKLKNLRAWTYLHHSALSIKPWGRSLVWGGSFSQSRQRCSQSDRRRLQDLHAGTLHTHSRVATGQVTQSAQWILDSWSRPRDISSHYNSLPTKLWIICSSWMIYILKEIESVLMVWDEIEGWVIGIGRSWFAEAQHCNFCPWDPRRRREIGPRSNAAWGFPWSTRSPRTNGCCVLPYWPPSARHSCPLGGKEVFGHSIPRSDRGCPFYYKNCSNTQCIQPGLYLHSSAHTDVTQLWTR